MRIRSLAEAIESGDGRWFRPALDRFHALPRSSDERLARFLRPGTPTLMARAPGRLDVMGGIADYSGSLVLELPLARSTFAILQPRPDPAIELLSLRGDEPYLFSTSLDSITAGELGTPHRLSSELRGSDGWAAYVLGIAQLCARIAAGSGGPSPLAEAARDAKGGPVQPPTTGGARAVGFNLALGSDVPEGKGVSSSAALEIASISVLAAHFGIDLDPREMAAACQWVENHVVGAPCGIMDQLTSLRGRADRLLKLRCQPASVEGHLRVPAEFRFYGIDSGVRHAVAGADYVGVRTAAFMGYRMIAAAAGLRVREVAQGSVEVEDPMWRGYLANLGPGELAERYGAALPERMHGSEFLARFGGTTDTATRVRPEVDYAVRAAATHPVLENARVERFAALLAASLEGPPAVAELGALMYESHASYGACGLGSEGTDRLVAMVRAAGPAAGLFGAKITGGGSGGTVAVLGRRDAEPFVRELAARYGDAAGVIPELFIESGPGADGTGVVRL